LKNLLAYYRNLERPIVFFTLAVFFININNAVYFLIGNIYMAKLGFTDAEIASFITYRTIAIMLFALPFGMFIKRKAIKPFYYASAIGIVLCAFSYVAGAELGNLWIVRFSQTAFGFCHMVVLVCGLPFILRNAKPETHTEAIALNYATWSLGMIISGIAIFVCSSISETIFTEKRMIQIVATISLLSLYFLYRVGKEKQDVSITGSGFNFNQYNWLAIVKCVFPTSLIAIGAGLTIPFINLFFYHVFNVDSEQFAILGSFTAAFVAFVAVIVPIIKRRFGYNAITVTQSFSVLALIGLATTEYFALVPGMVVIAAVLYFIRQPLMNMAGPLTSEMTMYYVGENNREILSALNSAIWSGSWFFSSMIFGVLRSKGLAFSQIFYITAMLYVVGVILYYFLIKDFFKKEAIGEIVEKS